MLQNVSKLPDIGYVFDEETAETIRIHRFRSRKHDHVFVTNPNYETLKSLSFEEEQGHNIFVYQKKSERVIPLYFFSTIRESLFKPFIDVSQKTVQQHETSPPTPLYSESEKTIPPVDSKYRKITIDNDGAFATTDLLDIAKDIRAFATLIALKEVKPPLAIALFGQWGTGKSFFMYQLRLTVDVLVKHQGFPTSDQRPTDPSNRGNVFCEGVVQIEFNAWSYLDANLWAGLVSTIFEKLDDYIKENVPGKEQKQVIQKALSEKLQIVSEQKSAILKERDSLAEKKTRIENDIRGTSGDKVRLLKEIRDKSLAEIRATALLQIQPLTNSVKEKIKEFGITEEQLSALSPNALYDEFKSWVIFFKNLMKFSWMDKVILVLAISILLALIFDPRGFFQEQFKTMGRGAMIILSIAGPFVLKWYNTFKKYRDLFSPVLALKNSFNEQVQIAEYDHQNKLQILEAELAESDVRLSELVNKLLVIDKEIEYVEYALEHSITKRAFFNFINKKNEDGTYAKHLGIISTIRRDFETLSNLFGSSNEDGQNVNKKERSKFLDCFSKPLDRIILYIDDLDRCSDNKVVEVLQAVHLLMAYPLFIVVVGVDKRCVQNALTYRNLLEYNQFNKNENFDDLRKLGINVIPPSEYLEKIFQIPFHLEDASDSSIKSMIGALLKHQVAVDSEESNKLVISVPIIETQEDKNSGDFLAFPSTPIGFGEMIKNEIDEYKSATEQAYIPPSDLKLTAKEVEHLKDIGTLVSNTPRTIKRYINMYRIIRVHELMSYNEESKYQSLLAIMFILAINIGRHSSLASQVFLDCKNYPSEPLRFILGDGYPDITERLNRSELLKPLLDMTGQMLFKHIPFVRRFSFNTY
jgi:hypothetical protein